MHRGVPVVFRGEAPPALPGTRWGIAESPGGRARVSRTHAAAVVLAGDLERDLIARARGVLAEREAARA